MLGEVVAEIADAVDDDVVVVVVADAVVVVSGD